MRKPNAEQREAIEKVGSRRDVKIVAGAGTGKTSTLEMIARAYPDRRILYLVFNKAAQVDGQKRMPRNVTVKTTHGLAYGTVGKNFRSRLNEGRMPSWKLARAMGYRDVMLPADDDAPADRLGNAQYASLVRRGIDRYTHSSDRMLTPGHLPWVQALSAGQNEWLREHALADLTLAWKDLTQPSGRFPFSHDAYLKLYQLGEPKLAYDLIMLDEAQDTNPCVADIVARQKGHAQIVLVGDENQAIYEWRGAIDFMQVFETEHRVLLTGSYRFGPEVAEEANWWLGELGSDLRLRGYKQLQSTVSDDIEGPTALLCRGNAGVIAGAMQALGEGQRVAIAGGAGPVAALARAAANLMAGAPVDHPDLVAFDNWQQVREYVKNEREDAGSLAPLVKVIDDLGTDAILDMCNRLAGEDEADLVVSTAHKAKGREWDHVQIGSDFTVLNTEEDEPKSPAEMRLAYVAATRAKLSLGRGSLSRSNIAAGVGVRQVPILTGSAEDIEEQERLGAFLYEEKRGPAWDSKRDIP